MWRINHSRELLKSTMLGGGGRLNLRWPQTHYRHLIISPSDPPLLSEGSPQLMTCLLAHECITLPATLLMCFNSQCHKAWASFLSNKLKYVNMFWK